MGRMLMDGLKQLFANGAQIKIVAVICLVQPAVKTGQVLQLPVGVRQ